MPSEYTSGGHLLTAHLYWAVRANRTRVSPGWVSWAASLPLVDRLA